MAIISGSRDFSSLCYIIENTLRGSRYHLSSGENFKAAFSGNKHIYVKESPVAIKIEEIRKKLSLS